MRLLATLLCVAAIGVYAQHDVNGDRWEEESAPVQELDVTRIDEPMRHPLHDYFVAVINNLEEATQKHLKERAQTRLDAALELLEAGLEADAYDVEDVEGLTAEEKTALHLSRGTVTKHLVKMIQSASDAQQLNEEQANTVAELAAKKKDAAFHMSEAQAGQILAQVTSSTAGRKLLGRGPPPPPCNACPCNGAKLWPFSGCNVKCGAKCGATCCSLTIARTFQTIGHHAKTAINKAKTWVKNTYNNAKKFVVNTYNKVKDSPIFQTIEKGVRKVLGDKTLYSVTITVEGGPVNKFSVCGSIQIPKIIPAKIINVAFNAAKGIVEKVVNVALGVAGSKITIGGIQTAKCSPALKKKLLQVCIDPPGLGKTCVEGAMTDVKMAEYVIEIKGHGSAGANIAGNKVSTGKVGFDVCLDSVVPNIINPEGLNQILGKMNGVIKTALQSVMKVFPKDGLVNADGKLNLGKIVAGKCDKAKFQKNIFDQCLNLGQLGKSCVGIRMPSAEVSSKVKGPASGSGKKKLL